MPFFLLPTSQIKLNLQLYPKNITFLSYFLFHIPTAMPRIAQVVVFTPRLQIPSHWSSRLLLLFLFLSSTDYIQAPQHFRHVPPMFSLVRLYKHFPSVALLTLCSRLNHIASCPDTTFSLIPITLNFLFFLETSSSFLCIP